MAKVNWVNGTIKPPEPGEYYTICEYKKTGEIWIDSDSWDGKCWGTLEENDPYWQVIAWARVLRPDIPKDLQGRVKRYFGKEVKNDGTISK